MQLLQLAIPRYCISRLRTLMVGFTVRARIRDESRIHQYVYVYVYAIIIIIIITIALTIRNDTTRTRSQYVCMLFIWL
jgi:Ca2+/Na+ antiporter